MKQLISHKSAAGQLLSGYRLASPEDLFSKPLCYVVLERRASLAEAGSRAGKHAPVCVLEDVKVGVHSLFLGWWGHLALVEIYILSHHELVPLVGCHAQHLLPCGHGSLVVQVPAQSHYISARSNMYAMYILREQRPAESTFLSRWEQLTLLGLRSAWVASRTS